MPYIAVKCYPRDDETKRRLAERLSEVIIEELGCPAAAVTVSVEDVTSEAWEETVEKREIEPGLDHVLIRSGEKRY